MSESVYDTDHAALYVRGDVEGVARALAEHRRARVWEPNAAGRELALAKVCWLVFRMRYQQWACVVANGFNLDEDDAAGLSRLLSTLAFYFAGSDTAGAYGYTLCESGTVLEWYATYEETLFESRLNEYRLEDFDGLYEFLDGFFRHHGVYALGVRFNDLTGKVPWHFPQRGERVTILDLDGAVERIDYVGKSAVRGAATRRKADRKTDASEESTVEE